MKRAIWGGTRLGSDLGKDISGWTDAAESWEVCDIAGDVSIVRDGDLAGRSLRQLLETDSQSLLGRHAGCARFPIMVKFLDAQRQLSVQVHPAAPTPGADGELQPGKAEAWVVLAADEGSSIHAGLKPGVTESQLRNAIARNDLSECLHSFQPRVGDCLFLEPGTVHALGGGILVAEMQRPSNITYRLYDWNRVDAQGRPRELHLEAALDSTNFGLGPVSPKRGTLPPAPSLAREEGNEIAPLRTTGGERLVSSRYFHIDRYTGPATLTWPRDGRCHVLVMISGAGRLATGRHPPQAIKLGETIVLPAERDELTLELSATAILLDTFLPDEFREF